MRATEGHLLDLRARAAADPDELESVRRCLVALLGNWLLDSEVVNDEIVRLRLATASRITAVASVHAAIRSLGYEDMFLPESAHPDLPADPREPHPRL